jgi:hypothetical protein
MKALLFILGAIIFNLGFQLPCLGQNAPMHFFSIDSTTFSHKFILHFATQNDTFKVLTSRDLPNNVDVISTLYLGSTYDFPIKKVAIADSVFNNSGIHWSGSSRLYVNGKQILAADESFYTSNMVHSLYLTCSAATK